MHEGSAHFANEPMLFVFVSCRWPALLLLAEFFLSLWLSLPYLSFRFSLLSLSLLLLWRPVCRVTRRIYPAA